MGHPGDDGNSGGGLPDLSSLLPTLMLFTRGEGSAAAGGSSQWLHLLLVLVLPLLLRSALPKLQSWFNGLKLRTRATRSIEYSQEPGCWWRDEENDEEAFNAVLQRAILKYLNQKMPDVTRAWQESDVQARKDDKCVDGSSASTSCGASDASSCHGSSITASSTTYSHYSYLCAPPNGSWVDLKNGIELERVVSHRNNEGSGRSSRTTVTTLTLRSTSMAVGPKELNAFIDKCLDTHNEELRSNIDNSRYFYTPVLSAASSSDDKSKAGMLYKRYKLAETRTFASFFHPERDSILALVDQFTHKTGKFSIPGYPLKLGFLLHGPPGTGKTSFIKALAQYTNRHVVNIPLGKIKTNQELMNIMLDQSICIAGAEDGTPATLPFSRTIFVMEDVDAASNVVHRRAPAEAEAGAAAGGAAGGAAHRQHAAAMEAMAMAAAMAAAASAASTSKSTDSRDGSDDDQASCEGRLPSASRQPGSGGLGPSANLGAAGGSDAEIGPVNWKDLLKDSSADNSDKLNLAALLNVLDGVVDTPDRLVILTTNHPEKLDPALIRPGRINRKVYLGNVRLQEAKAMIQHYFTGGMPLAPEAEQRLTSVFVDGVMSPAQVESMCAEFDSVDEMIDQLDAKMQRLAPAPVPLISFGSQCSVAAKMA